MLKKEFNKMIILLFVILVLFVCNVMPLLWMILTSFKTANEVYQYPPLLFPNRYQLNNYYKAWSDYRLGSALINSVIISSIATFFIIILGSLSGYCHSKLKFKGNSIIFLLALMLRMVPPITVMVPLYNLGGQLGLLNTRSWLIILNLAFNLPTSIWIFKVFFDNIPSELIDAAKIDGCGNVSIFTKIMLPLTPLTAAVVIVLTFPAVWNEFLLARTFAFGETIRTLPVALEPIISVGTDVVGVHWGNTSAAAVLIVLPLIPIAVFFQKYLVSGMMAGAIKG